MELTRYTDSTPTRENLLNPLWNFTDYDSFQNEPLLYLDDTYSYFGKHSLKASSTNFDDPDNPITFQLIGDYIFTAPKSGYYFFSFFLKTKQEFSYEEMTLNVYSRVNDLIQETYTCIPITLLDYDSNGWNRFAFQFNMTEGQTFYPDFQFVGYPGADQDVSIWLDGFNIQFVGIGSYAASFYLPSKESASGWANYKDLVHTLSTPLIINEGLTSVLTNNGGIVINNNLPTGITRLYNAIDNKFIPSIQGDYYIITVHLKAENSELNGLFDLGIDVGGSAGIVLNQTLSFNKGADTEQDFIITIPFYADSAFTANGGIPKIKSIKGNTSIYDIVFEICRVHKSIT